MPVNKDNSIRYNNSTRFIQENNLIDLDFTGNLHTWHEKREKQATILARLDRNLANHLWVKTHPYSMDQNGILHDQNVRISQAMPLSRDISISISGNEWLNREATKDEIPL